MSYLPTLGGSQLREFQMALDIYVEVTESSLSFFGFAVNFQYFLSQT